MIVRPRKVAVALVAAACTVVISACAPASNDVAAPSTQSTVSSSAAAPASGPAVTVPGLSTAASSSPEAAPAPVPTSEPAPETSTPEPAPTPEPVETPEPEPVDTPEPEPAPEPAPAPQPAPQPAPSPAGGKVVVIDPGHNGANAANPGIINALVDAGFGDTKPCNTTGTSTNDGYSEHAFTWGVATRLQALLEAQGITVIMTRYDDAGVGPCVNERARIGNDAGADLVLSIHGDGVNNDGDTGFYVMTAERKPAGAEIAARSDQLATDIRNGLVTAGLQPSNYLGSDGLWERGDLAGLNLSTRPTVMVESGNMRAPADAALMSSAAGQQQFAEGYANGVLAYLAPGAG